MVLASACKRILLLFIFWQGSSGSFATHDKDLRPLTESELSKLMANLLEMDPLAAQCPAPRVPVPRTHCGARPCVRQSDCQRSGERCCFNGCVFTCLPRVTPPPVIDWVTDAAARNLSSYETTEDYRGPFYEMPTAHGIHGILCTTAPVHAPALPLQCPEGMVCITRDVGDPLKGIPSLGECVLDVRHRAPTEGEDSTMLEHRASETIFLPGGCVLSKEQYNSIEEFKKKPYITGCTCKLGSIDCSISRKRHRSGRRPGNT